MQLDKEHKKPSSIVFHCYHQQNWEGEHFVPEHTLSYQIAGSLTFNDGSNEYVSSNGSFRFLRRNQLMKFLKQPPEHGEYQSVSIYLDQQTLKDYCLEYGIEGKHTPNSIKLLNLQKNNLFLGYIDSLFRYHKMGGLESQELMNLKLKEAITLVLITNPELKDVLFDFTDPHKIDLEAFMNKNYHFNVKLDRFAYLTGRSLATFKRDFETIFNSSPGRWLQQKRLEQAYYLITRKGKTASDIYLDLGFEDLSHFSFVFKKMFGESPSKISSV
ncbi:helix-turn-helix domain-containing protein [Mariniflexile gromovii]|uniref:Helix-turn-helix transcriptional regulator n=1 Tax=Mariniflexile gromovii TaxID=362523 RepID=A0ABS4BQ47_9FLAO|nr:AraC family transcriptional regulator [Mariniflexile gromovii]MBP0902217.1 helix-turn-helix transcriptional regulator [Mariniflexile gromovii]